MISIYKYQIQIDDVQVIKIPRDAKILCVQCQREQPCIWAMINTTAPNELRKIGLTGTGHLCDSLFNEKYIGTFQMQDGSLVFHVFDMGVVSQ